MMTAVREVSVFGDAIVYFNEAAALLDLEPGMRRLLTRPSRQIIFSIPFQRDSGFLTHAQMSFSQIAAYN